MPPAADPYLDGEDEILQHLPRRLLSLESKLGSTVHEVGDHAELSLLHAASGERRSTDADTSRAYRGSVPLGNTNTNTRKTLLKINN